MDTVSLVVGPIVNTVIQDTTNMIKNKIHLIKGVEEDIEELKSKLTAILSVVEDAEVRQLDSKAVRDWLGKLEDAAYDAKDILDTYETEAILWQKKQRVRKFSLPFSASKNSYKLNIASDIKAILGRIDKIAKEKDGLHLKSESNHGATYQNRCTYTTPYVYEPDVVGRKDDKEEIINLLISEKYDREGGIAVIPIIGMGGLGKTTLAQLVYNDDRVKPNKDPTKNKSPFEFAMWVHVTMNYDYKRILKEMIEYHSEMKYDTNSISLDQLESRFREFLAGKCFLLVLDDVWFENYQEWGELRKLLALGGKGCRVLVTARNTKVSNAMGTQPPYHLGCLPEEQCWSLFQKIVFEELNVASNVRGSLEDSGRKIVSKCKGLPLAVKAMAGVLRGNDDAQKWKRILNNEIWEAEEGTTQIGKPMVLPALKLSYDHLPSHLKQCFAYCYIFPKAYVFDKIELVKVWKALSFIQPIGQDTIDQIGSDYFDELLMRSFFQVLFIDKNKKRHRMHDLIHELAQSVSSPQCCQVKDNESCPVSNRCRHVSLLCDDVEKAASEIVGKSDKLRTLVSPGEHLKSFGRLDNIFHAMKYMRVLDLSSSIMLELPESVKELKLLRYLNLSKTEIRKLPNSICSLYHLQTLKLLGCLWLFELPKDLGNLTNLQHLELDEMFWYKSSTLPPRMGSLTKLENLHAFHVVQKSGYGIDELGGMIYLKGALHISKLENAVNAEAAKLKEKEGLEKVVFEWSTDRDGRPQDEATEERVLEDLQPHSNLKELQIFHYRGIRFPSWIGDGFLQNLVTISISHCTKCKVLSLGQLPHLEGLYIKGMQELEEWSEVEVENPSLRRLEVCSCPNLKKLPGICLKLMYLKIKKCDSLRELPSTPSLEFLILVENLVLESVNDKKKCFRVLELKIIKCPNLQALPIPNFGRQLKLEISEPQLLRTLSNSKHYDQRHLDDLALGACHDRTLVCYGWRLIRNSYKVLYSLVISNISSVTSLPKWPDLPGLMVLYIRNCEDLVCLSEEEASLQGLTSLEVLSIWDCPKLVTLPDKGLPSSLKYLSIGSCPDLKSLGPRDMLQSLTSLGDLYIVDCPAVESLPEGGVSSSLKHMHVEGCPLLSRRCRKDSGPDWSKINDIPDLDLESIEASSVPNSLKEHPKIKASSATWYHHFTFCKGIDIKKIDEPQQRNSLALVQRERGQTSKVPGIPTFSSPQYLMKKWVDDKCGCYCFMLYARLFSVTGRSLPSWEWKYCYKEISDENIEVVKLSPSWKLDVRGKFKMSDLSPGVVYEITYEVKLTNGASGYCLPITLRLSLPNGKVQERQVSLSEKPRGQWMKLKVGNFLAEDGENREVCFDLYRNPVSRLGLMSGLIIRGATLMPKAA